MSLVLTELSEAGIVMVADSSITTTDLKTKKRTPHAVDWLKVLPVESIKAGMSYWGNFGTIAGATPLDHWFQNIIKTGAHTAYTDLPSFADYIASSLNKAALNKPFSEDAAAGIHIAGNHKWEADGQTHPTFYHVHNGHGRMKVQQDTGAPTNPNLILRTTGKWVNDEPRKLFQKHLDFPFSQSNLNQNLQILRGGYITRNGDYFPYLIINKGLDAIKGTLNTIPGISVPPEPHKLPSRLGYLSLVMQTVIRIYNCSTLDPIIGGELSALGIKPDGRYIGLPSRKSRFTSTRTIKPRKLP